VRDQLNQLVLEKKVAALDDLNRLKGPSRSSSERHVRFNRDSDAEYERGRSLSPVPRRREDRRGGDSRGDRRGDWRDNARGDSSRGDYRDSSDEHGARGATERGRSMQRNYTAGAVSPDTASAVSPDRMRFYGYREAPTPQPYPPLQPNEWRQEQAPQWGRTPQFAQPPQWGRGCGQPLGGTRGNFRGSFRGGSRGNFCGNAPRGNFRGSFRGRDQSSSFPNQGGNVNGSCFKCGGRRHDHLNMCPAINQFCRGCGRKGHFLRVCRSTGAPVPSQ